MEGRGEQSNPVEVMIASPLEEELVRELEGVSSRIEVLYEPDLLPPPRYPSDHRGDEGFRRDAAGERRWEEMLARAEVLFGVPGESAGGLADAVQRAPSLRWLQATSAGAGEQVRGANLSREELERVTFTTASGVHAVPLAEFCLLGILTFAKDLPRLERDKSQRRWDHYPTRELRGGTVLIVGVGEIGVEVARLARCFGMHTVGLKRRTGGPIPHVDEVQSQNALKELIPRADAVVVTLPLTQETEGMIDREAVGLMRPESVFVNVGRGGVVDEAALTAALEEGRIAGAALDVFEKEPLPSDSPLWSLPNVLLSPHTAALAESENQRIVELFKENLRCYLDGEPLRNRVEPGVFY
ncbi:MAG: D-2-hydroxyacid dehydrogenase [Rubrobacter sp.]|nr:D-2-hydroxyacid dehydrogenase [Rubrobacter sp.]